MGGAQVTRTVHRSRRTYRTARAAWSAIAKATGLESGQAKPAHTARSWRWTVAEEPRPNPPSTAEPVRVQAVKLGQAVAIDYRRRGRTYRHTFGPAATLYRDTEGRTLLIAPVQVGKWIRG